MIHQPMGCRPSLEPRALPHIEAASGPVRSCRTIMPTVVEGVDWRHLGRLGAIVVGDPPVRPVVVDAEPLPAEIDCRAAFSEGPVDRSRADANAREGPGCSSDPPFDP